MSLTVIDLFSKVTYLVSGNILTFAGSPISFDEYSKSMQLLFNTSALIGADRGCHQHQQEHS